MKPQDQLLISLALLYTAFGLTFLAFAKPRKIQRITCGVLALFAVAGLVATRLVPYA